MAIKSGEVEVNPFTLDACGSQAALSFADRDRGLDDVALHVLASVGPAELVDDRLDDIAAGQVGVGRLLALDHQNAEPIGELDAQGGVGAETGHLGFGIDRQKDGQPDRLEAGGGGLQFDPDRARLGFCLGGRPEGRAGGLGLAGEGEERHAGGGGKFEKAAGHRILQNRSLSRFGPASPAGGGFWDHHPSMSKKGRWGGVVLIDSSRRGSTLPGSTGVDLR
ncbi:MAG: hypothetical protein D6692_12995 [Planctomycetota bacterium]|nr:MAG: hypothetical protein D6692_12995 [Planctomycetota bacterium]